MDLTKEILQIKSKESVDDLAKHLTKDTGDFHQLMKIFLGSNTRITPRAAWIMSKCHDINPHLVKPFIPDMVKNLQNDVPDGVKRSTLRALQNVKIPTNIQGVLTSICFKFLNSPAEAVAIKVFSMTVLSNIAEKYPDLKTEIKLIIEDQMPYGSAGFKSRGRKILKKLGNIP